MDRTPLDCVKNNEFRMILPECIKIIDCDRIKKENDQPPSFCSEVYYCSPFILTDKLVFLYIDVENGTLNRYLKKDDFLDEKKAENYVKINDIQDVVYTEGKDQFYFKIITSKTSQKYYSKYSEITCE